jgi:hypothetical protein
MRNSMKMNLRNLNLKEDLSLKTSQNSKNLNSMVAPNSKRNPSWKKFPNCWEHQNWMKKLPNYWEPQNWRRNRMGNLNWRKT